MKISKMIFLFCVLAAAFSFSESALLAQGQVDEPEKTEKVKEGTTAPKDPPEIPGYQRPDGPVQGFHLLPTVDNTYVVTHDLSGLRCVAGVGTESSCAVTKSTNYGNGYPWTLVPCRPGDQNLSTFAVLTDKKRPVTLFDAPPALIAKAKTYSIDVRLGRVCMSAGKVGKRR